jgi:hypothetical protein
MGGLWEGIRGGVVGGDHNIFQYLSKGRIGNRWVYRLVLGDAWAGGMDLTALQGVELGTAWLTICCFGRWISIIWLGMALAFIVCFLYLVDGRVAYKCGYVA